MQPRFMEFLNVEMRESNVCTGRLDLDLVGSVLLMALNPINPR